MADAPKVSVVIPVYNVEKYLRECLDSVVNQTLRDIEIICVDDGSTDGSSAILAEYAAKDPRVKVITRPHTNAGAARNAGMAIATGEYLGFVDSDDWCELTLFEKAYEKAKQDDVDLVFWRYQQYNDCKQQDGVSYQFCRQLTLLPPGFNAIDIKGAMFSVLNFAPWNRLCRRSFIWGNRILFQEIDRFNDVCFSCLTLASAKRISLLNVVMYHYRVGVKTSLQTNNKLTPCDVLRAWERLSDELACRGMTQRYHTALATSASNSIIYTLGTISEPTAFKALWGIAKRLYSDHPFYSRISERSILNSQTAAAVGFLKSAADAFDYLLMQSCYQRKLISEMFWAKESEKEKVRQLEKRITEQDGCK